MKLKFWMNSKNFVSLKKLFTSRERKNNFLIKGTLMKQNLAEKQQHVQYFMKTFYQRGVNYHNTC